MGQRWRNVWHPVKRVLLELASAWLCVLGLVLVTWGVCLFLFPLGLICGGLCAILLEWRIDLAKRGR